MGTSLDQFFEAAPSLPLPQCADLAFQLLQSLDCPGEEIAAGDFGSELRERVAAYRRGQIESSALEETRAHIQQRLSAAPAGE
jgi:hypothetical protein